MVLYKKDNIEISLIEENDIRAVLQLFNSFDFNVTLDTGSRPSAYKFERIIRENIEKCEKLETVLVLKKANEVIGYLSCFIDYSRLVLGHIAVKTLEQHHGYGRLLTLVAMSLAAPSNREVSCVCYHRNNYLTSLGFETRDNIFYVFKGCLEYISVPNIFMSIKDYEELKRQESLREIERFQNFLNSDFCKFLRNL